MATNTNKVDGLILIFLKDYENVTELEDNTNKKKSDPCRE